ncbi:MAG: cytochrome c [Planctomycetota bacterium]
MSHPRGHTLLTTAIIVTALAALVAGVVVWRLQSRRPLEPDLPAAYRSLENPYAIDATARDRGMRLYLNKGCAACHGAHADGKGPAARGLTPAPADFTAGKILHDHSDAWLYWRISEGKHGTAMPRWDGVLEEKERWEIVGFLRSLEGE